MPIKKTAFLSSMLTFALILSYIESLIPFPFGIPGMKLGLTNLLVVLILYRYSAQEALLVNVARILLSGFLFGNGYAILYSLAGGILSLCFMTFLKRTGKFSVLSISASGGVFHNLGQLFVAAVTVSNYRIAYYAPILMVCGCLTGCLIGVISGEVMKRMGRERKD